MLINETHKRTRFCPLPFLPFSAFFFFHLYHYLSVCCVTEHAYCTPRLTFHLRSTCLYPNPTSLQQRNPFPHTFPPSPTFIFFLHPSSSPSSFLPPHVSAYSTFAAMHYEFYILQTASLSTETRDPSRVTYTVCT